MCTHKESPRVASNAQPRAGPNNARRIEQAFVEDIQRRFRKLRGLIRTTVGYENDALGLTANAEPRERFEFESQQGLTAAFIRWLRDAIRDEILEPLNPIGVQEGEHWTSQYIREAYIAGVNQATGLLFQRGVSVDNAADDTIPTLPYHAQTLKDLYQRTYGNLQSITRDMVPQVREILTTGFVEGVNPKEMARRLTKEVRDIQRSRAETLARTETMHAHASGTVRQYRNAGVNVVSHTEWKTADDSRVCPFCSRLDGIEVTLDEVESASVLWAETENRKQQNWRLMPPAHPNCRCVLLPVVGGTIPDAPLSERIAESFDGATVVA